MFLYLPLPLLLLLISLIQEIIFWKWKVEIFDWNPETKDLYPEVVTEEGEELPTDKNEVPTRKLRWKSRKEIYRESPCAWRIYRFILETGGIFVGWYLLIFTYKAFMSVEISGFENISGILSLLMALIIGLIGVSGRIPIIIDSVQEWFRR